MPDCGGCDVHYSSCYGVYGSCGCICTGGGVGGQSGGSYDLECRNIFIIFKTMQVFGLLFWSNLCLLVVMVLMLKMVVVVVVRLVTLFVYFP